MLRSYANFKQISVHAKALSGWRPYRRRVAFDESTVILMQPLRLDTIGSKILDSVLALRWGISSVCHWWYFNQTLYILYLIYWSQFGRITLSAHACMVKEKWRFIQRFLIHNRAFSISEESNCIRHVGRSWTFYISGWWNICHSLLRA